MVDGLNSLTDYVFIVREDPTFFVDDQVVLIALRTVYV